MNLCKDCKYANWNERAFYENAHCSSLYKYCQLEAGDYVFSCSAYESKSIIKRLWRNFLRRIK